MKKLFTAALVCCAALCTSSVYAEVEPHELEFEEVGGGKFIYCNNPEAIDENTVVNSDKPRYIMNNENLGPGKYYIYLSHFNYIGGAEVAKDMELDVELTPVSGSCDYTISDIGFETGRVTSWHENGRQIRYEQDWGMLNACAQAMDKTICDIDGEVYYPCDINSGSHSVTASKTRWISEFIENYGKTHYMQPVHLQAVLEIKSGTMNVNVCAFRSGDELGDRSGFRPDAEHGIHRRDRCIKGIADTFPQVRAKLEYTINDSVKDGDFLPVSMHNSYAPDGIVTDEWFTHINPLDDPWAKAYADESGMLAFTYEDDSKRKYYGKNVKKIDNIWHFDTRHTDTHEYEARYGGTAADYKPNFDIDITSNASGYATNLGNYGITYTYDLSITNDGTQTRYFTYAPTTNSNIIVYTDENGEQSDFALAKKLCDKAQTDVMSVVELTPGETTEFSVNVILPVNFNGGTKNGFVIRDHAEKYDIDVLIAKTSSRVYDEKPIYGKYLSEYKDELPASTLAHFNGNLDSYEVVDCSGFYAVRWCVWDGKFNYYHPGWWLCSHLYFLDENMNVASHYTFDSLPVAMSYNEGRLYVKTARMGTFSSADGAKWRQETEDKLPEHQIPEKHVTLGNILDAHTTRLHKLTYSSYSVGILDYVYDMIYDEIKDIELTRVPNSTSVHAPDLDALDIFKGMIYDGKVYYIAEQEDVKFVQNLLMNVLFFMDDTALKDELTVSDWAINDVRLAFDYGIIPLDMPKYTYSNDITRKQFCILAANVLKYTGHTLSAGSTRFVDTDDPTVCALAESGIINGYGNGYFYPDKYITREEAAVILSRMLADIYILNEETDAGYVDADFIQDWAKHGVNICAHYGIMNGIGNNRFAPTGAYTVEQSAITMLRVFNTAVDAGYLILPSFPQGGSRATIYREGYRNNRIELALYDTESNSTLINDNGALSVSGSYKNDVKYYFSRGSWIEFERGYERISNNATAVLFDVTR